ncbi:PP2C family protein-serine/threonine phosphatase [Nocardioides mangrovi]|uniref:Protein phosphatase 2C domain-containing protein n=1 Tax=Nocardioides mangrovi TaxID=2874580 RepID=A0ABS7UHW9_9ACTN|nr:protein phosphatase 2C domain-containing protein [Nocardioides mangrovi]MBZ5740233.1 protein phosphatase 2C domain-containing protein [Nocardioides mangrovi]
MLRFSGAGVSDVGRVRPHNEDSAFQGPYVAVVADGVGGAAAGEVASATTAYVVAATALAHFGAHPESVLTRAVATSRRNLRTGVVEDPERAGMATTLTAVLCDGERIVLAHVGDSRAYLVRDGELRQVSQDHTYVQHLVDTGQLDPADRARHPWRNVVLRSLDGAIDSGSEGPDLLDLDARVGDRILLCSDGLTDMVADDRIAEVLTLADPHSAAAVLTQSALLAGGVDNITCVVLDVVDGPAVVGDGMLLGALREPRNIVDPASVRRGQYSA